MNLRVVQFLPNNDAHAFDEVAEMLVASLADLSHDVEFGINEPSTSRLNIFLGCNLLRPSAALFKYDYIAFQSEQLFEGSPWWKLGNLHPILQRAKAVWDYSPANIEFLSSKGIPAAHLPIGFHPVLQRIRKPIEPPEHDVLFYGSRNERRNTILAGVSALPSQPVVTALFGAYGKQRDAQIARARINMNIHYYEAMVFEAVRVSYLLNNGAFTISESSPAYPWPGVDLPMADALDIPNLCQVYLEDESERNRIAALCREQFADLYPMTKLVEGALSGATVQACNAA